MIGLLAAVVLAETQSLVFGVTPLGAKLPSNLVSVTAFVSGGEDPEAVRKTLEADLAKRGKPALAVVGVAGVGQPGAKVVIEHVSSASRAVNANGIAFISGQPASTEKPVAEMAPLVEKSFGDLRKAHAAAGVDGGDVLRLTCLVSSLADLPAVRGLAEKEFPKAARDYVQLVRFPTRAFVECETVVRLRAAPAEALRMVQPEGLGQSPNYSHVALLGPGKVAFSGMRYARGMQDSDVRELFTALDKSLATAGSGAKQVAMSSLYPTSTAASDLIRRIRFEFYDRGRPPASTMVVFESLPQGAPFAAQVVAVVAGR
jgi:enamine deaminase RidA (YjgF/YER057c/UK114 family)